MDLNDLRTMVRGLVHQGTTDTGLFTNEQLESYIQIAHSEIHNFIAHLAPSYLATVSDDKSITSAGLLIGATRLSTSGVSAVVRVELKNSSGKYTLLDNIDASEVGGFDSSEYRWYVSGEAIYLDPAPGATETIRVTYVPGPAYVTAGAMGVPSTHAFNGALPQHHHLVAFRAADIALTKDERSSTFHQTYLEMKKDLADQIRRRHVQHARRVRMSPWED